MKRAVLLIATLLLTAGRFDRLPQHEQDHFTALKVFLSEKDQKAWLKLKTEDERNTWLKERKLWDRFYQHDEPVRQQILQGDVKTGWTEAMVNMAWGRPAQRLRNTDPRIAGKSDRLIYLFEVTPEGRALVWHAGSKETHTAIKRFRIELVLVEGIVETYEKQDGWELD